MGTPGTSTTTLESREDASLPLVESAANVSDPLSEIGSILAALNRSDQRSAESASRLLEARHEFVEQFQAVCKSDVRPAMEAVMQRLRQDGGDGLIEEHPGGEARVSTPRLTLWMSLQGEIVGAPET